jgi:pyruvate dehydrogenase E2 component (dihydrolipoamide acetyltransferase)
MTIKQFLLPDLGEGLEEAQLVTWLVREGEAVRLNQPICQVETAKALVDIPSPYAGTVQRLHARPGETVAVGAPLITVTTNEEAVSAPAAESDDQGPVLVGYGTEGPAQTFQRRRRVAPGGGSGQVGVAAAVASVVPAAPRPATTPAAPPTSTAPNGAHASPLVRKIATERGIDLSQVRGTGPGGRIRMEDLEALASQPRSASAPSTLSAVAPGSADETRISTIGIRKAIAAKMQRAWATIPHMTEYVQFDALALTHLRARLRSSPQYAAGKLTFTPFLVAALVRALVEYPILNSRWDEEGSAIVLKGAINVGVATDTERGLVVPVIHGAQALRFAQLAAEAERLAQGARAGTLDARAMTGGTITLTNVGAAGPIDTGAPIINAPEVACVGFGAIKPRPMVVDGQVVARPAAWISMSADHRVVDGATAARFLGRLVELLEHPDELGQ